jgi:hypothetical protein
MSLSEVLSLSASVASLVLALVAIWLSVVFFRMSSELSSKTTEAADAIRSSVEKLETLFERLYADTFSMMRDTVSDMRKHMWPENASAPDKTAEAEKKKADEKVNQLKKDMEAEALAMLNRQKLADEEIATLGSEVHNLIDHAIAGSRQAEVEAREETIRDAILSYLRYSRMRRTSRVFADDIISALTARFPLVGVLSELQKMADEGIIELSETGLRPTTEVILHK